MEKYRLQFNALYNTERMKNHVGEIKEALRPRNLALMLLDKVTGGWSAKIQHVVETYTEEGSTIDRVAKSDIMQYAPISVALGYRLVRFIQHRRQKRREKEHETANAD